MDAVALIAPLLRALSKHDIPYVLVGSFSSNQYGIPRSTKDADLVLQSDGELDALMASLGPKFVLDPQLSFETVTGTMRWIITHPESAFIIELFLLTDDPHDQARFGRRVATEIADQTAWVVLAEDVIITKLRWARDKDLADVRDVIAVQGDALDWAYIEKWTSQHGTEQRLAGIRERLVELGF